MASRGNHDDDCKRESHGPGKNPPGRRCVGAKNSVIYKWCYTKEDNDLFRVRSRGNHDASLALSSPLYLVPSLRLPRTGERKGVKETRKWGRCFRVYSEWNKPRPGFFSSSLARARYVRRTDSRPRTWNRVNEGKSLASSRPNLVPRSFAIHIQRVVSLLLPQGKEEKRVSLTHNYFNIMNRAPASSLDNQRIFAVTHILWPSHYPIWWWKVNFHTSVCENKGLQNLTGFWLCWHVNSDCGFLRNKNHFH